MGIGQLKIIARIHFHTVPAKLLLLSCSQPPVVHYWAFQCMPNAAVQLVLIIHLPIM